MEVAIARRGRPRDETLSRVVRRVRRSHIIQSIWSISEDSKGLNPKWRALLDTKNFSGPALTVRRREERGSQFYAWVKQYLWLKGNLRANWIQEHERLLEHTVLFGAPLERIFAMLLQFRESLAKLLEPELFIRLVWLCAGVHACENERFGRKLLNCLLGSRGDRLIDFCTYVYKEMHKMTRHMHIERVRP
eukprot:GHVU01141378.1.p1 GENE.GHVU01141378.1~~GHVU01141378.1.p1  ORF type:complete len:191 (+),score=2.13 GHVU01141378.1:987-1559(+)